MFRPDSELHNTLSLTLDDNITSLIRDSDIDSHEMSDTVFNVLDGDMVIKQAKARNTGEIGLRFGYATFIIISVVLFVTVVILGMKIYDNSQKRNTESSLSQKRTRNEQELKKIEVQQQKLSGKISMLKKKINATEDPARQVRPKEGSILRDDENSDEQKHVIINTSSYVEKKDKQVQTEGAKPHEVIVGVACNQDRVEEVDFTFKSEDNGHRSTIVVIIEREDDVSKESKENSKAINDDNNDKSNDKTQIKLKLRTDEHDMKISEEKNVEKDCYADLLKDSLPCEDKSSDLPPTKRQETALKKHIERRKPDGTFKFYMKLYPNDIELEEKQNTNNMNGIGESSEPKSRSHSGHVTHNRNKFGSLDW
ncbi:hypothetical protein THOM_2227 [Trachipleistophora hominis]|uniref:Uncharacterized protein n=1 Tax=Trachipleistophora hominis TaxID=72359 RepID=L7JTM9_TRAHO|nr:hypothetical protein THOM_2227 [Trachipleistophora hominis]